MVKFGSVKSYHAANIFSERTKLQSKKAQKRRKCLERTEVIMKNNKYEPIVHYSKEKSKKKIICKKQLSE